MVLPGMSDGRKFTDYTSSCYAQKKIYDKLDVKNANEYRKLLQSKEYFLKTMKQLRE
jgi:hypothetical protein